MGDLGGRADELVKDSACARAPNRAPKRFDGGVRPVPPGAIFVPDYGSLSAGAWPESVLDLTFTRLKSEVRFF